MLQNRMTFAVVERGETMAEQIEKDDLISRRMALEALRHVYEYNGRSFQAIKNLPSAQPEQKPGKWIYKSSIGWGDTWICSECGEKTTSTCIGKPRYKWCPMCGAKMGEQDG